MARPLDDPLRRWPAASSPVTVEAGAASRAGRADRDRRVDEDGARGCAPTATASSSRCAREVGDVVAAGDRCCAAASRPPRRRAVQHGCVGRPRHGRRRAAAARRPAELRAREALLADASRPDAVAKRHALGLRTARENIADLCDAGSFIEYGALAFAAQRTPARARRPDPQHAGRRHGHRHRQHQRARCSAPSARAPSSMAYDATVLAGTQGMRNHQKTDRMLGHRAHERRLPVVLFAEGGGGRPGDTDMPIVAGLHVTTFAQLRAPERPGAGDRHRRRPLLRRQRRAARLLRRDHRHRATARSAWAARRWSKAAASARSRPRRSARATCSRATA